MNKEHFWPRWLIRRTRTNRTGVKWIGGRRINPNSAKLPLCRTCNSDFGRYLEEPVQRIFDDLEQGNGLSDVEAELLVRWLWKLEGLSWIFANPQHQYTEKYTLRQRVLQPIDEIRQHLVLCVGRIGRIEEEFGDAPLGLDSNNLVNAVCVSGVFSKLALLVVHERFASEVPHQLTQYKLARKADELSNAKLFFPEIGFQTCVEAVGCMRLNAPRIARLHDFAYQSVPN